MKCFRTWIVENIHFHILPSFNPDGFSLRKHGGMVQEPELQIWFKNQIYKFSWKKKLKNEN